MKNAKLKKPFKLFIKHFESFEDKFQKKELQKAYNELQTSYTSLKNYKELLEQRVQEEILKREINEKILARQSRLAAMGEMMDAVAHQWSQPLAIIDMNVNLMTDDFKRNIINEQYINKTVSSINLQTKHLQSTLTKFRNFLKPIDKKELLDLNVMVKETLPLVHDEILKHHIDINYSGKEECIVYGSLNEIQHVLINLINNAKDAFILKNLKNRSIDISIKNTSTYFSLIVEDSAGGINKTILKDIFKPYVSTKNSTGESGIGLYMSYLIMQKHNGKISAKNSKDGAKFIIKFYKEQ